MGTIEIAKRLGQLNAFLAEQGLQIEEITEMAEIVPLISSLGKPYLTPMSSPDHNDFTESNIICLVAKKDGRPVMMGCARLEDIGTEPVGKYWSRVFKRAYGTAEAPDVVGETPAMIDHTLTRRLVYFGDLFVAQRSRGGRLPLRAFVAIGHLAVSLKWDPDWTYCFIRERDLMLGASELYGFNRDLGPAFSWLGDPPPPRDRSEQLVAISRADLPMMTKRTVQAVTAQPHSYDEQRKIQNGRVANSVAHAQ